MQFVPSEMLRTRLSWLVVGGVAVVVIAAVADALRRSGSEPPPVKRGLVQESGRAEHAADEVPATTLVESKTVQLERFTAEQLTLRVERLGGTPVLALAHVRGEPCRTPRIPIEVRLFARDGTPV